ncbi:MAG TPA: N-acetylmuramoyl-L-alanine amidase [Parachlamydiales bacterium]|nr:N-acetylmuramoyl-L-alanine amidase [Parachlamydiales bacterium]
MMLKAAFFFISCFCWMHAAYAAGVSSLNSAIIVIDAGHGGTDRGTWANAPFCEEKRICLQTSRLVKKYLDQLGYRVVMTRMTDVFIPLSRRVEIADQARASLFVSIHYNSAPVPSAKGIEIFYSESKGEKVRASASKKLAQSILSKVIHRTSAQSRGVKKRDFLVIRETSMPAILIEGGFISNQEERENLKDHVYIDKIARGIADGIDSYTRGKK